MASIFRNVEIVFILLFFAIDGFPGFDHNIIDRRINLRGSKQVKPSMQSMTAMWFGCAGLDVTEVNLTCEQPWVEQRWGKGIDCGSKVPLNTKAFFQSCPEGYVIVEDYSIITCKFPGSWDKEMFTCDVAPTVAPTLGAKNGTASNVTVAGNATAANATTAKPANATSGNATVVVASANSTNVTTVNATDWGWPFGGEVFKLFPDKLNWDNAENKCVSAGGHLATFQSAEKLANLFNISQKHDFFVGITDKVTEGTYLNVDGTPPPATQFMAIKRSPLCVLNCGTYDCVRYETTRNFGLVETVCNGTLFSNAKIICEKKG